MNTFAPAHEGTPSACVHVLEKAIETGHLVAGAKLADGAIQTWLGVSRASVREALVNLAGRGLVDIGESQFARVAAPSIQDANHAMQVAAALLGGAARVTMHRLSGEQRDRLGMSITQAWDTVVLRQPLAHDKARARLIDTLLMYCPNEALARTARSALRDALLCLTLADCSIEVPWRQLDIGYYAVHKSLRDKDAVAGGLGFEAILSLTDVTEPAW